MTEPTPPERPRPQYGEYATPAEQRAHIRDPAQTPHAHVPPAPAEPAPAPAPAPSQSSPMNRFATIALLAYGAINVALSAFSFLDLKAVADATYRMMGISGTFADTPSARAWGIACAAVMVAGFVLTAVLSVRRMRRGRSSWWIPVAGAVVTYLVVSGLVAVPLMTDPAFQAYLQSR